MMKPATASCLPPVWRQWRNRPATSASTPQWMLLHEGDRIAGVKCGDEIIKGDAYVMAFGSYRRRCLKGWWIYRSTR